MSAADSTGRQNPLAAVHVDLDGARHIFRHNGWEYTHPDDPLFASGMENLLAFLERDSITATMFVIAEDLEDACKRELLVEAVKRGHEIASHSVTHARLARLPLTEKRREIATSRARLEDVLGTAVKGFRAPGYEVDRECFELLEQAGYRWDSSTFPTAEFASRLGVAAVAEGPHRPIVDSTVWELPLPRYKPAPFPFHPCYALILGLRYFRWRLGRFRCRSQPLVWLFHLTDLARPLPPERLPGMRAKLLTLSHLSAEAKIQRCQTMMDIVRRHYDLGTTSDLLDNCAGTGADHPLGEDRTVEPAASGAGGESVTPAAGWDRRT